jgi:hypothetical protein
LSELPNTYFDGNFWGQPEEIISASIFGLTLIGYLIKGKWRNYFFDHWIVLFLIISTIAQFLFKSNDVIEYDILYLSEHILFLIGYLFILISLLIELYQIYKAIEEERSSHIGRIYVLQSEKENLVKELGKYKEEKN